MRFYILVCCHRGNVSALVHDNGFMYYTRVPFQKNSMDTDTNITTGYIDRAIYERNPLTHKDFIKYLDSNRQLTNVEKHIRDIKNIQLSKYVFGNIYDLLKKVMYASTKKVCKNASVATQITFQLFGADVAVSDDLTSMVIEINKGPDLGYKDDKDGKVKKKVVEDMFKTMEIIPDKEKTNGFIELF